VVRIVIIIGLCGYNAMLTAELGGKCRKLTNGSVANGAWTVPTWVPFAISHGTVPRDSRQLPICMMQTGYRRDNPFRTAYGTQTGPG